MKAEDADKLMAHLCATDRFEFSIEEALEEAKKLELASTNETHGSLGVRLGVFVARRSLIRDDHGNYEIVIDPMSMRERIIEVLDQIEHSGETRAWAADIARMVGYKAQDVVDIATTMTDRFTVDTGDYYDNRPRVTFTANHVRHQAAVDARLILEREKVEAEARQREADKLEAEAAARELEEVRRANEANALMLKHGRMIDNMLNVLWPGNIPSNELDAAMEFTELIKPFIETHVTH